LIQINKRAILAIEPPTESGKFGQTKMAIPHWLIALVIFALLGAFIAFAFRQGQKVKPDRNKDPDDWTRLTGGGGDHTGI
jgi:hypothetical protein